jgi:hypothetical protein
MAKAVQTALDCLAVASRGGLSSSNDKETSSRLMHLNKVRSSLDSYVVALRGALLRCKV